MHIGGLSIIVAILLILIFLLQAVLPLFAPASMVPVARYELPARGAGDTLYLALEEYGELAVRFTRKGHAVFFSSRDGRVLVDRPLPLPPGTHITGVAHAEPATRVVALGLSDGRVLVTRHQYDISYPEDRRLITPHIDYPLGEEPLVLDHQGHPLVRLAIQLSEEAATLVGVSDDGRGFLVAVRREVSFLDNALSLERHAAALRTRQKNVASVLLDTEQRLLYLVAQDGAVEFWDVRDTASPRLIETTKLLPPGEDLTALTLLSGGISLIAGGSRGTLNQWFPVRHDNGRLGLAKVREFAQQDAPVRVITPEYHRKGFLTGDSVGRVGIYHATANNRLLLERVTDRALRRLAVSPRAEVLIMQDDTDRLHVRHIDNEHPEVSWSALWGKVWYEHYSEPETIWQSSSASNDFEPKFSLTPLAFGTLKAAFYAMLLALPLAVLGAIYTAFFMSSRLRRKIKPTLEIMAALPTVILGFLAGLWLAPILETRLPGFFTLLLCLPLGVLLFAYGWHHLPGAMRYRIPDGWQPALLIPVVIMLGWASFSLSEPLEAVLFDGNMPDWLSTTLGMDYAQRNALVVGLAMGFAVIPMIFSIAEDAIFSVPKPLVMGSLAMGATPWQTLIRVVLPSASPGIFSAIMIGMGRAVGETMIVLMATGNTPVMDFSLFQGMRTLSANIAMEMPESQVASTHYRVLFLAALLLFLFTFLLNTAAELLRQRLRKNYGSL